MTRQRKGGQIPRDTIRDEKEEDTEVDPTGSAFKSNISLDPGYAREIGKVIGIKPIKEEDTVRDQVGEPATDPDCELLEDDGMDTELMRPPSIISSIPPELEREFRENMRIALEDGFTFVEDELPDFGDLGDCSRGDVPNDTRIDRRENIPLVGTVIKVFHYHDDEVQLVRLLMVKSWFLIVLVKKNV